VLQEGLASLDEISGTEDAKKLGVSSGEAEPDPPRLVTCTVERARRLVSRNCLVTRWCPRSTAFSNWHSTAQLELGIIKHLPSPSSCTGPPPISLPHCL